MIMDIIKMKITIFSIILANFDSLVYDESKEALDFIKRHRENRNVYSRGSPRDTYPDRRNRQQFSDSDDFFDEKRLARNRKNNIPLVTKPPTRTKIDSNQNTNSNLSSEIERSGLPYKLGENGNVKEVELCKLNDRNWTVNIRKLVMEQRTMQKINPSIQINQCQKSEDCLRFEFTGSKSIQFQFVIQNDIEELHFGLWDQQPNGVVTFLGRSIINIKYIDCDKPQENGLENVGIKKYDWGLGSIQFNFVRSKVSNKD